MLFRSDRTLDRDRGDKGWNRDLDDGDLDYLSSSTESQDLDPDLDPDSNPDSYKEDSDDGEGTPRTNSNRDRAYSTYNSARSARNFKRRARERKRREELLIYHTEMAEIQLTKFTEPFLSLAHTLILRDMRSPPSSQRYSIVCSYLFSHISS